MIRSPLKQIDIFAGSVSLNLRGRERIGSNFGGTMTLLFCVIILLQSSMKFADLVQLRNPLTSQFEIGRDLTKPFEYTGKELQLEMQLILQNSFGEFVLIDPQYLSIKLAQSHARSSNYAIEVIENGVYPCGHDVGAAYAEFYYCVALDKIKLRNSYLQSDFDTG